MAALDHFVLRAAVERKFEIIGEATTQALLFYPEFAGALSYQQQMRAFRNVIAHNYFRLDVSVIWATI